MRQFNRFRWLWLGVCLSLLACQPIKPMADIAATPLAGGSSLTPCQLTAGQRLGNEEIQPQDAPPRLDLAGVAEPGVRLVITGVVYAADCTTPLADAMLEVWQADAAGAYGDLAGTLRTDANGHYELHTVKPGYYAGEANPPPLHIHLRVDHPAAHGIETEFFFADDPLLDQNNPTFRQLSIPLEQGVTSAGVAWYGTFSIVLAEKEATE
jgi:catechol 1,2-dioxygenase